LDAIFRSYGCVVFLQGGALNVKRAGVVERWTFKAGDVCVFRGTVVHSGAAYRENNVRLHYYFDAIASPKEFPNRGVKGENSITWTEPIWREIADEVFRAYLEKHRKDIQARGKKVAERMEGRHWSEGMHEKKRAKREREDEGY
jgi:hypothetical protein